MIWAGLAVFVSMQTVAVPFDEIGVYEPRTGLHTVTACDRLTGQRMDPYSLAHGPSWTEIEAEAAIAACAEALDEDPDNPRLLYQMSRALNIAERYDEALPYRERAVRAGYPHALFMDGYILITGWNATPVDPCHGGEMVRRAAERGHFSAMVGFPHYALTGEFAGCETYPVIDRDEMLTFLEAASYEADDFHKDILVEHLYARVQAVIN
jgi:tetratricopeptide (TPR) repeat protein